MGIPLLCGSIFAAAVLSYFLFRYLKKEYPDLHPLCLLTGFIVPFAAGGFYTWTAVPLSTVLMWYLWRLCKKAGGCTIHRNLSSAALLLVLLGFGFSCLWAADKGMAAFGFVRFLPVALYALVLMQLTRAQRQAALAPIPLCGAMMTALTLALQFLPALNTQLTVNGRLAGTFEYPNTYAAFLLAGLMIQGTKENRKAVDLLADTLLILGIISSGSRTAFILLALTLVYLVILRRKPALILSLVGAAAVGIGAAWVLSHFRLLENADRYTTISVNAGTFLVRLLYFKDALGVILRNPLGLGYWGYRAMEGSFQTGRYFVAFVHNGLLQLLLDVGWIPALLLAAAFLKTIFRKAASPTARGVLLVVLAHCMLDFDLQFCAIWFALLPVMDLDDGKTYRLTKGGAVYKSVGALLLALCLWLGIGDFCMNLGNINACLQVTPFHTQALIKTLDGESDPTQLQMKGQKILQRSPYTSIGYSALANAAFSQGDVIPMIQYKEQAIACAKYTTEEYCDYIDKLCVVYNLYVQAGDRESAAICAERIVNIETMIQEVSRSTSRLAYLTGDDPSIVLPEEYRQVIEQMKNIG